MKVIFCQDVVNVAKFGQIKEVADGYARNYLLPRGLALPADAKNRLRIEKILKEAEQKHQQQVQELKQLAAELEKTSVTITARVGPNNKLFGAITNSDIAAALKEAGLVVEKQSITLEAPIKECGIFNVEVKLAPEITARVKVWIVEEKNNGSG